MKNKIYKILSITLAICLLLSCCAISLTASAQNTAPTYYISAVTGDNSYDGSEKAPLKTIGGALTKAVSDANANGYNTEGNTIYFKVLDAYNGSSANLVDYSDASGIKFNFNLNISSATSGAAIGKDDTVKDSTTFGGSITLENIEFHVYKSDQIYLNGNDFIIGDNVNFKMSTVALDSAQTYFCLGGSSTLATTPYDTQNIKIVGTDTRGFTYFCLGGGRTANYDGDLNLIYNSPNNSQNIRLGTVNSNYSSNYNGNINLNFQAASKITLITANEITFGEKAAFQIINSTGNTVDYSALGTTLTEVPTYVITNNTGVKDIINFTDVAGEYAVDSSKYIVTATPNNGGASIDSKDNKLVLNTGEYTLSYRLVPKEIYYYISNQENANDSNAGTKEAPFKTIAGAISAAVTAANAGEYNSVENTVYLKILNKYEDVSDIINYGAIQNLTYNFTLNISSENEKACFGLVQNETNTHGYFGGPTVIENVNIRVAYGNYYYKLFANGNNLTIGSNVDFIGMNIGTFITGNNINTSNDKLNNEQVIEYNYSGTNKWKQFSIGCAYGSTYNKDFTLIYNSPNNSETIYLAPASLSYESNGTNFKAGLNLDFRASKGIVIGNSTAGPGVTFGADSTVQIINSTKNTIDYSAVEDTFPSATWIITNNTDVKDLLTFTETAGTYNIKSDYKVIATPVSDGEAIPSENGKLVLKNAGEYTLTIEEGYDVNNDGRYDICDLVYTDSLVGKTSADADYNSVADKDNDGDIDTTDIAIVKNELLTGKLYGTDTEYDKIITA